MAREVSLTSEDVKALEEKLKSERGKMSPEEINFTEHLIRRGSEGQRGGQAAPSGGIGWTWTYRF